MICRIVFMSLVSGWLCGAVFAQGLVLEPSQTVNPATGEMQLSLPIATIHGVAGHDFPFSVGYQAGIRAYDPASPIGLGFSYGAGSITRSVVQVPDNNLGGSALYSKSDDGNCSPATWKTIVHIMLGGICTLLAVAAYLSGYGTPAGIALTAVGIALSIGDTVVSFIKVGPSDYVSGGYHLPKYTGDGKGFFKGGVNLADEEKSDLPDRYFINTPYISGEIVWAGGTGSAGHFIMKQSGGSIVKDNETAKISYDGTNEKFVITLADGCRLVFATPEYQRSYTKLEGFADQSEQACSYSSTIEQKEWFVGQWYLSRVLFADYAGGIDDECTNYPSGWIKFEYNTITNTLEAYQPPRQASERDVTSKTTVYFKDLRHLSQIVTPNEKAIFNYIHDRLDNAMWVANTHTCVITDPCGDGVTCYDEVATSTYYLLPRLTSVDVKTKDNVVRQSILFETDYTLRPGTLNAYSSTNISYCLNRYLPKLGQQIRSNTDKASLTLNQIKIQDPIAKKAYPVKFEYDASSNYSLRLKSGKCPKGTTINDDRWKSYVIEERDLWGFYRSTGGDLATPVNDFNINGAFTADAFDACAWSLKSVTLPTGMSVSWEYEPNRYDMANNKPVNNPVNGQVRVGGGIRVKSYTVNNGLGKLHTRNYFYTDMKTLGKFEESDPLATTITNSSGHATAEPFPYVVPVEQDIYRNTVAKGGFYTPAKVAYERVIMVDNYQAGGSPKAPYGYTVMDFVTSKDFPNVGTYGHHDESWRRGMMKRIAQYNSANVLVTETVNEYEYNFCGERISGSTLEFFASAGIVRLSKQTKMIDKVKSVKAYRYAGASGMTTPDMQPTNVAGSETDSRLLNYLCVPALAGFDKNVNYFEGNVWSEAPLTDIIMVYGPFINHDGIYHAKNYGVRVLRGVLWQGDGTAKVDVMSDMFFPPRLDDCNAYSLSCKLVKPTGATNPTLYLSADYWKSYNVDGKDVVTEKRNVSLSNLNVDENGTLSYTLSDATTSLVGLAGWKTTRCILTPRELIMVRPWTATQDLDGQPNQIIEYKAGGTTPYRVTYPIQAYWMYSGMKTKNMLTQTCGVELYNSTDKEDANLVNASVTTWGDGSGAWRPKSSYIWTMPMNAAGTAASDYDGYNFTNESTNNDKKWICQNTVAKYDDNGNAAQLDKRNPNGGFTPYVTITGHKGALPIASIANAPYDECGVFTCDYDNGESGYFDKANGWEKNGTLNTSKKHFGEASIRLYNSDGPCRNFYVTKGKNYTFSAWVKLVSGTATLNVELRESLNGAVLSSWPIVVANLKAPFTSQSKPLTSPANAEWTYLEVPINTAALLGTRTFCYARAYVTTLPSGEAYVDDIRFAPSKSLVSSTYYHPVHQKPVCSVDANNQPSRFICYDGFGREEFVFKIDRTKSRVAGASYDKLVTKKEYHLMKEP